MRSAKLIAAAFIGSALLAVAGCSPKYDYPSANNFGSKRDLPRQDTSRAYQTQQEYARVSHQVTKLDMNQFLSDQVAAMDGVGSAIVMMGDHVAYTAITIDSTATGTKGGPGPRETNNYGWVRGLYNPARPYDDTAYPDDLITGFNGDETEAHHEHLSHLFKQKIAEKIRLLQPDVSDVYITANRIVVNEFTKLAQEAWHGRSLDPYRGEFITMMEQLFGTSRTIPNQAENNGREY
ncbi:hypothetical protein O9H85_17025 [Paenibacillus filicis]|uniref:Sporulation protein n=1 Tax=Paenibacillus gyeongsangnamensis TaxID=3388067 RepID=A0ABT4QB36_9BACL|nr:hypothetical protein [Paenibacillus filicis]MCZ8514097.1 hypothetical protein [Paenibacillus filicis]